MGPATTATARPAAASPFPRWLLVGCLLACVLPTGGCRSNAYRDVYTDKMAAEIRALEDQLYAADYENKVLHQKLQRSRTDRPGVAAADLDPDDDPDAPNAAASDLLPQPDQRLRPTPTVPDGDEALDLDFPDIDPGQLRTDPLPPVDLPEQNDRQDVQDRRIEIPGADLGLPRVSRDDPQPMPPSSEDLVLPPIEAGDIVPPPGPDAPPEPPPGQIPLPESLLPAEPKLPTGLSIHPIYSGGHNFDADPMIDGVHLVVQFVDDAGTPLDMGDMDIDAQLIVVLLDPQSEGEDPRLGRWEFSADAVAKLRRDTPVDGLHVPLRWDDRKPAGQQVAAFVRLVNGSAKLEGEHVLNIGGASAVADWTPTASDR